jgi:hypothetical protein
MTSALWTLPTIVDQVETTKIEQLPKRETRLLISLVVSRNGNDFVENHALSFEGTELFSCTYLTSLTAEMIQLAYGKLVDLGKTELLNRTSIKSKKNGLRHLMICFDDGPCYEVVCKGFSHAKQ